MESFLLHNNLVTTLECLRMPFLLLSFMQELDLSKPCGHAHHNSGVNATQGLLFCFKQECKKTTDPKNDAQLK
jgi:hypothetical protein